MIWPAKTRLSKEDDALQSMAAALDLLAATPVDQSTEALTVLINTLRPARPDDVESATLRIKALALLVTQHKSQCADLHERLLHLLATKQALHLYTDSGILSNEGFSQGFWRRIGQKLLPDVINRDNLRDNLRVIFKHESDHRWVEGVSRETWIGLLDALTHTGAEVSTDRANLQLLDALQVISYRITALGLEPELVRNHPAIERYESPFLMQNVEVRQFIDERKQALAEKRAPTLDDKHLQVLLEQCGDIVQKIRRTTEKGGASVSLTYLLVRLEQNLARTALLLRLFEDRPEHDRNIDRLALFQALVRSVCRRNHIGDLWVRTTELLAQRITGHAGKAGESYITANRREYLNLCRAAAGAGLLVAFMSFIKLWQASTPHAPFVEAFLFSSTYAIGFMLMSAFHFSLATKQPAMTANRIAHSLDVEVAGKDRLDGLTELVVRTLRSQFIALIGNFLLVIPLVLLLTIAVLYNTDAHYISTDKANALLQEVDPFSLRTWVWAAVTGVWLFASGLISGYYDNKAVYDRIPQRLQQLRPLRRLLGAERTTKFAQWVENHLGALAGSFFFGIMLGSTGALGDILGLPLDTLHVTFSTANVFYALSALDWIVGPGTYGRIALGISIVGMLNLAVSFGLALYVAMRAQRVEFSETWPLTVRLAVRFRRNPRDFIYPPPDPEPVPEMKAEPQKPDGA